MPPMNVTVRRVDAEATEIAVKKWQRVHPSVLEGLQLSRYEWAVCEVRCGDETLKAGATWESEGGSICISPHCLQLDHISTSHCRY